MSSLACSSSAQESGADSGNSAEVESTESSESTETAGDSSGEQDEATTELDDVESESDEATGTVDCSMPSYEDDLILDHEAATKLPGRVIALAVGGDQVSACGRDFVSVLNSAAGTLNSAELETACRSITFVDDRQLALTDTAGALQLWVMGKDGTLEQRSVVTMPGEAAHELTVIDDRLWVAAAEDGLLSWTPDESGTLEAGPTIVGPKDARDLVAVGDRFVVADGFSGVKLIGADGEMLDQRNDLGEARALAAHGQRIAVVRGFRGLELLEVAGDKLERLGTIAPDGLVLDAVLSEDELLVDFSYSLRRYSIDESGQLHEVSRERRPTPHELKQPWFLALAAGTGSWDQTFVGLGDQLVPLQMGDGQPAPDLRPISPRLLVSGPPDSKVGNLFVYENSGQRDVIIDGFEVGDGLVNIMEPVDFPPERPGCPGQYLLAPGERFIFPFEKDLKDDKPSLARLAVSSNDPDTPRSEGLVMVNRPTPETGAESAGIGLLSWHGHWVDLSDYLGKVVFLKLANSL